MHAFDVTFGLFLTIKNPIINMSQSQMCGRQKWDTTLNKLKKHPMNKFILYDPEWYVFWKDCPVILRVCITESLKMWRGPFV